MRYGPDCLLLLRDGRLAIAARPGLPSLIYDPDRNATGPVVCYREVLAPNSVAAVIGRATWGRGTTVHDQEARCTAYPNAIGMDAPPPSEAADFGTWLGSSLSEPHGRLWVLADKPYWWNASDPRPIPGGIYTTAEFHSITNGLGTRK